jgi:hypothetical protein
MEIKIPLILGALPGKEEESFHREVTLYED